MPDHTSWFTYLLTLPGLHALEQAVEHMGLNRSIAHTSQSVLNHPHAPVTLEYTLLALFAVLVVLVFALITRARIAQTEKALIPEGQLTISSFTENFVEAFYNVLKDALGAKDAKYFLPIIGTCALFIFFSNALGLIPGFSPATSNFNVTLACGLVIFITTHLYGLRRNGVVYLKHFLGPVWWLAPLMLPLELISHIARPITLAIRLMVNMFVDHLVVSVFTVLVALVLPVPIMLMGVLVVTVQTYVFCLLSTVYVQMAIEHHDDHGDGHAHGHEKSHDKGHGHAQAVAA
jgi:F-type H+-transporting ATPase subunit a